MPARSLDPRRERSCASTISQGGEQNIEHLLDCKWVKLLRCNVMFPLHVALDKVLISLAPPRFLRPHGLATSLSARLASLFRPMISDLSARLTHE